MLYTLLSFFHHYIWWLKTTIYLAHNSAVHQFGLCYASSLHWAHSYIPNQLLGWFRDGWTRLASAYMAFLYSICSVIFQQAGASSFIWWLGRVPRDQMKTCNISGELPSKWTQQYILLTEANQKASLNSKFKGWEITLYFLIAGVEKSCCKGS